jgi:hypothetical protein
MLSWCGFDERPFDFSFAFISECTLFTRVVSTTSMGVSQMSVKELVLCLNQCALPQLAKLCDENFIYDGRDVSCPFAVDLDLSFV